MFTNVYGDAVHRADATKGGDHSLRAQRNARSNLTSLMRQRIRR